MARKLATPRTYVCHLFQVHDDGTRSLAVVDEGNARHSLQVFREFCRIGYAYVKDGTWQGHIARRYVVRADGSLGGVNA